MDMNRLTQKSQEAVQSAQSKALRYGHGEVDGEHLLLVLLEQADGILPGVLKRLEIPVESLRSEVEGKLEKRPRISGPGAETHITRRLQQLFIRAEDVAVLLLGENSEVPVGGGN